MHDDEAEEIESFEAIVAELARLRALNAEMVGALETMTDNFYMAAGKMTGRGKRDYLNARAILARAKESAK